jgi:hypothetical protein
MSKRQITNVAGSVHQRLLNIAKHTDRRFNDLVQYYTDERWLYRLSQSRYGEQFVLKGALMLLVWKTRDVRQYAVGQEGGLGRPAVPTEAYRRHGQTHPTGRQGLALLGSHGLRVLNLTGPAQPRAEGHDQDVRSPPLPVDHEYVRRPERRYLHRVAEASKIDCGLGQPKTA